MKSVNEHNKEMHKRYRLSEESRTNGIECPLCGLELYDSAPGVILSSYPPQKRVNCKTCGYSGLVII